MILSQRQLEEIAASTTKDFNRFFFGDEADKPDRSALPTPIDQFAKNYLGLRVSFARLSPDGSICGVTAYADTEYKITELGITRTLALKRNQVILDESFIRSGNVQRLCAKRRFTLAHECAHQILFQLESERKCYRKTRRMKQSFGLYFFPGKGVRVMACKYLDFQDRKKIAKMYQEEARVLDIAYKIGCHPATIYEELRRGDTGKLDKNQRPEYDPRLAQRTFQEAIRRRGNRRTTTTAESGQ